MDERDRARLKALLPKPMEEYTGKEAEFVKECMASWPAETMEACKEVLEEEAAELRAAVDKVKEKLRREAAAVPDGPATVAPAE